MYGFVVSCKIEKQENEKNKEYQIINCGNYRFCYNQLPKFQEDHLFFENSIYVVLLDGVIFNKKELMKEFALDSWKETFLKMLDLYSNDFMNKLRGSFRGCVLKKSADELIVFTNHLGEKTVYYAMTKDGLVIGSNVEKMLPVLKLNGFKIKPNIQSSYELLLTGTMLHGNTPCDNIFFLQGGQKLTSRGNIGVTVERYHQFHNIPEYTYSLEECIETADGYFRQAVNRIFSKNEEYGYRHECDLSGGLDSRLATWVAHDLGYRNVLNVCYCEKGKIDHITSKKIAEDLGNEYLFYPMDGSVLMDVDEKTKASGGQVEYSMGTGAFYVMDLMDSQVGLCCTGLLGEVQNAYWIEGDKHTAAKYISNRLSSFYELDVPKDYSQGYDNYEQMNLYEYSCNAFLRSSLFRNHKTEVASPFIDVDFLEYVFRIPLKWRKDYHFVMNWMIKKYPRCASYVWQTKRMPVDAYYSGKLYVPQILGNIEMLGIRVINKALRMFHINRKLTMPYDMNPFDAWYKNEYTLRSYFDNYFNNYIDAIFDNALRESVEKMYQNGNVIDKLLVINVIAVWKLYFTTNGIQDDA